MAIKEGYLVFDIGTGNARVAIVETTGEVVSIEREDIQYEIEPLYPDSRYFSPELLWKQLIQLAKKAMAKAQHISIKAITSTSQRQGIVLQDQDGHSFIGLPNIDNRGREWEKEFSNQPFIYERAGRLPSALFSALKLVALQKRQPQLWDKIKYFTSISEWVAYKLSDVLVYEPSQATETLLYDVQKQEWSEELCEQFGISVDLLPELKSSGSILGEITTNMAQMLGLDEKVLIVVGGGDTQLAIASTFAEKGDVIIVSGTTTPICHITDEYSVDSKRRAWTNAHTNKNQWLLETNPGITGLNYQKLKNIFYPNESYQLMEEEMSKLTTIDCVSTLGMYLTDEKNATKKGGFIFNTPLEENLTRAHFVASALWEIACTVKWHFDKLCEVIPYDLPYVWACGGGFQSETLTKFVANLLQKEVRIHQGFNQASVVGSAVICNKTLGVNSVLSGDIKAITNEASYDEWKYEEWKQAQQFFFKDQYSLNPNKIEKRDIYVR
ncbi:FGGY-family carbohydrate kinase [Peribacillus sp. TH24]|uniref:FGGY-family carbohydrate kinase n=1 Tax=Peribacillus sp. TH24 TaxID=2798483 RepID=UPI00191471B2|nr:FGGY family carbohydrate kinase [Peribacillus sp. TH24]MBK5443237.1 sugar kinase [Peribacillus sp. TH24]